MAGRQARYTHGHSESVLRSHRWRTAENSAPHLLPHLRPGQTVLDVGAGPGTLTVDLARRVFPGVVHALEVDDAALALSRAEAAEQGVDLVFSIGDAQALDLADDSFDVVHAHQVLQHLGDPVQALREMARVCRPGGVIAVRDSDYAAFSWYPAQPELDEWLQLYRSAARANGGEPDAGRRLLAWAHAAGLDVLTAGASTWCFASPEDRAWWGGMWADRITGSALSRQLLVEGRASPDDLRRLSRGWRQWSEHPDGWFTLVHGELLILP